MARALAVATVLAAILCGPAWAVPAGRPEALDALALCRGAERLAGAARIAALERGLALATAALAADQADAAAHFATFCTVGRLVELRGLSVFRPLEAMRALDELDVTLRLAPDDPDVLTATGAALLRLPRMLGGDAEAGRTWLRRALARDPGHREARAYLRAAEEPEAGAIAGAARDC